MPTFSVHNRRDLSYVASFGYFLVLVLVVFGTKLHGIVDVQVFVSFLIAFSEVIIRGNGFPRKLLPLLGLLIFFAIYSGSISALYGWDEYIFFLKFSRTLLTFLLLYYVYRFFNRAYTYDAFCRLLVLVIFAHSVIVILCVVSPEIRGFVYSLTGYAPRGPEWSRSPGLTISFNATAIVHIVALWFVVDRRYWSLSKKLILGIAIVTSLLFLGRTMSYLGMLFIFLLLITRKGNLFKYSWVVGGILLTFIAMQNFSEEYEYSPESVSGKVLANLYHFSKPLVDVGAEEGGVDDYFGSTMSTHIYFPEKAHVLLFGDSQAGHIGIAGGIGKTNSDMGLINSINANGLPITLMVYGFYFFLIYLSRTGDWRTVSLIAFLSMALSFKETGLFTSHATQVLFIIFFYQFMSRSNSVFRYG